MQGVNKRQKVKTANKHKNIKETQENYPKLSYFLRKSAIQSQRPKAYCGGQSNVYNQLFGNKHFLFFMIFCKRPKSIS